MTCRAWNIAFSGMLCLFSSTAFANNFNYNFFEFRASSGPQSIGAEFTTYIQENFHTVGRLDKRFNEAFDLAGGVGFNGPAGPFVDVNGQLLVHYTKANKNDHDDGMMLELNVGARAWLTQTLEIHGKLGQINEGGLIEGGVRFHSTSQLTFGAQIRNNGLWGPQTTLGVRFEF
ncbi:hypothetical protein ACXJY6_10575 [Vibrio sp. RC27]